MTRQAIIEKTIQAINQLPEDKALEIFDFADFIMKKYEEQCITDGLQQLASKSNVFDFLHNEDDLYTLNDLKEQYRG
jgi:hypothetical protein